MGKTTVMELSKEEIKRIHFSTTKHFSSCTGKGCIRFIKDKITDKTEMVHIDPLCNKLFPKTKKFPMSHCPCSLYSKKEIKVIVKKAIGKFRFFMRYYII